MNKKGFFLVGLETITIIWLAGSAIMIGISQLPAVKNDFRAKKAVKVCEAGWLSSDCEAYVGALSKAEIMDLIRDDKVPAKGLNYGNLYTAPKDTMLAELK